MIIIGVGVGVLLVVAVGLWFARRVDGDSTNFLVAGRSLALPLSAAGLMGQAVDSNATLGNMDLTSSLGFWAGASLPLGLSLCLLLTGLLFAARMNAMSLFTLPDFYRQIYGRGVEVVASVLMIASFCILLAGNLVAGGFLFERFLGTSYTVGVLLIVVVVLAYTLTGGMFSDAYTALVQMVITVIGSVSLLVWVGATYGLSTPDGMGPFDLEQLTSASAGAPINWATLISLGIGDIVAIDFMQRIFSARSPSVARRACFTGAALTAAVGVVYALVALAIVPVLGPDAPPPVLFTLLEGSAPAWLAILVLSAIVAASCSTANGVVLGTASVAVRNIQGLRDPSIGTGPSGTDPLLRAVRWTMLPVVAVAILFALQVPQTGILLTLAFDLLLACLLVPFVAGHWWPRRATREAAIAAVVLGLVVRLTLFALTPTIFGAENTLLYIPNTLVGPGFDGYPTFLGFAASILAFVVVALLRPPREAAVLTRRDDLAPTAATP
ncbi:sodium:solute symporter family transporter [Actinomycetospora sp. CA-101289]|uniref:sodium:solute symporter family transporter n=1 Tax=Actinomycetospora sp. CA-101289 TaxID=3239893 RepID=UPI003D99CE0E